MRARERARRKWAKNITVIIVKNRLKTMQTFGKSTSRDYHIKKHASNTMLISKVNIYKWIWNVYNTNVSSIKFVSFKFTSLFSRVIYFKVHRKYSNQKRTKNHVRNFRTVRANLVLLVVSVTTPVFNWQNYDSKVFKEL